MITKEKLEEWKNSKDAANRDVYNLAILNAEMLYEIAEDIFVLQDITDPLRDKVHKWVEALLNEVETWDKQALPHVLEDFGIVRQLANVLIEYQNEYNK